MVTLRRLVLIVLALVFSGNGVRAASSGENRAYKAAGEAFNSAAWWRAEAEFDEFPNRYLSFLT